MISQVKKYTDEDVDKDIKKYADIQRTFGKTPQFTNREEFEKMMKNGETFKL